MIGFVMRINKRYLFWTERYTRQSDPGPSNRRTDNCL